MNYKFTWDNETNMGYVQNDNYPDGEELDVKPQVNTAFDSFVFDDEAAEYSITVDGIDASLTLDQQVAILDACIAYPAIDFALLVYNKKKDLEAKFNTMITNMSPHTMPHEMTSWRIQETEARNWDADNNVSTPMIDILLVARDADETKQELVTKIIGKADAYLTTYADYLGRFHKAIKLVDAATTEEELDAISI